MNFSDIAKEVIKAKGYVPLECDTEEEARSKMEMVGEKKYGPAIFFEATLLEKNHLRNFFTNEEKIITDKYDEIGVIEGQIKRIWFNRKFY